jgi:protein ImuB
MAPKRMMVIEVEDWPAVAAGCAADIPAAVVAANRVLAATPAARDEGVRAGMRRREAQGRCPEIAVVEADPGRDIRAWEPVVAAVEALVTEVEVLGPGRLCLAVRGPSRYFGGDSALARRMSEVVVGVVGRVGCRIGVADGLFAAVLAAGACRLEEHLVVPAGRARNWLVPHPVTALGAGFEDLADLLRRLGVHTLGDLANLPEPSVLGRFGVDGIMAQRLAKGLDDHPFKARTPPPDLAVGMELDPPESRIEAVAFVAKALADELLGRLEPAGLVCTKVAVEVETEHGERLVRHWRHEGELSAHALSERTRWQLEGWLSGSGAGPGLGTRPGSETVPTAGVTLVRLVPDEVRPDLGRQLGFWGGWADSDSRAARAFARVQGLLGPDAVVTAVLRGGRGPLERIRYVAWGDARDGSDDDPDPQPPDCAAGGVPGEMTQAGSRRRERVGSRRGEAPPPWPGRLPGPSPALVHREPRSAEVRDGDGRPLLVSGRGGLSSAPASVSIGGGVWRDVVAWAGPWPVEERWWDGGGRRRARFQILLDGGEAHLLTRESGRWWIEASYG